MRPQTRGDDDRRHLYLRTLLLQSLTGAPTPVPEVQIGLSISFEIRGWVKSSEIIFRIRTTGLTSTWRSCLF